MTFPRTLQCSVDSVRDKVAQAEANGEHRASVGISILTACCEDVDRLMALNVKAMELGYVSIEHALDALKDLKGK